MERRGFFSKIAGVLGLAAAPLASKTITESVGDFRATPNVGDFYNTPLGKETLEKIWEALKNRQYRKHPTYLHPINDEKYLSDEYAGEVTPWPGGYGMGMPKKDLYGKPIQQPEDIWLIEFNQPEVTENGRT